MKKESNLIKYPFYISVVIETWKHQYLYFIGYILLIVTILYFALIKCIMEHLWVVYWNLHSWIYKGRNLSSSLRTSSHAVGKLRGNILSPNTRNNLATELHVKCRRSLLSFLLERLSSPVFSNDESEMPLEMLQIRNRFLILEYRSRLQTQSAWQWVSGGALSDTHLLLRWMNGWSDGSCVKLPHRNCIK
jgi:hypothetical protein